MGTERMELLSSAGELLERFSVPEQIAPESIRSKGIETRNRKKLGELEYEIQKNLETLKEDQRLPEILSKFGKLHLYEGDFARAILLFEISLGLNSEQVSTWIHMGLAYYLGCESKDAISCFGSALAIDADNKTALVYLALAQLDLEEYDECLANLDRILKTDPTMARAMHGKGLCFKKRGNIQGAISWFHKAIETDPDFLPSHLELGLIYTEQKKMDKAEISLLKALRVNPNHPYVLSTFGDLYLQNQEYEKALEYFEVAVSIKFDDPDLWIRKGDTHKRMKMYREASNAYQKAINADPENVIAWAKSGAVMALIGETGTALEYYNTALALQPNNPDVAHQRGLLYFSQGKFEDALEDFDAAFSHDIENPQHIYYRAQSLEKLGRNDEAKRTWKLATSLFKQAGDTVKAAECSAREKRIS
jgi:tetratricopeptide (TPR) repeat protein